MDPLSLIGGLFSGAMGFFGQQQTNQQNAANVAATNQTNIQLQQQSQQFEQQMSNTAYQRASKDMEAAGLNPSMMFGSGGPASTPNVAPARVQAAPFSSPVSTLQDTVSKTVNSAVQMKTIDKMTDEIANLQAANNEIVARTANIDANTQTELQRPALVRAQTEDVIAAQALKRQAQTTGGVNARSASDIADFVAAHPVIGKTLNVGDWIAGKVGSGIGALSGAFSKARDAMFPFP